MLLIKLTTIFSSFQYIGRQIRVDRHTLSEERIQANLETICISMNYQLRSLIEWAKDLKSFNDLSDNDKVKIKESLCFS